MSRHLTTALALLCFAANGLLCRLALAPPAAIDAATFTAIRLTAGALVLFALARTRARGVTVRPSWSWPAAAALFLYAAPFSFAYLALGAGVGALVLFGSVQITMIAAGIARGERPSPLAWVGLVLAMGGLAILTVPGTTAPHPLGLLGMTVAGIAWGAYSLYGRTAGDPLIATAQNFALTLPMAAALLAGVAVEGAIEISWRGAALAAASGALASGLGYAVWYAALRGMTATRAAILQLLVPIEVAAGGVLFLGEGVSPRLVAAGAITLGGVALAIRGRS